MDWLMLDVRTLAFVAGLGGFILAGTMFGLHVAGTRQAGVLAWGVGGLLFGAGYLLGHLLLTLDLGIPRWLAGSIANNLIAAGHALTLIGVQRYLGYRPWNFALLIPVGLVVLTLLPVLGRYPWPFIAETSALVFLGGYSAWLLWRAPAPGITAYRRAAALVLAVFAVFLFARTGYVLITRAFTASFDPHALQIAVFLGGMLFGFALTMALVLLIFREKELHMREIAVRDALTGLYNRYALSDASNLEFELAQRDDTPLSLLAIDLDHFKSINDRHGHATGDLVLREVSELIRQELRNHDRIYRIGGEEFLVLLPATDLHAASALAERLRKRIEASMLPMATGDQRVQVTASFGVAQANPERESWDHALLRADQALYRAKESGRNRVCPSLPTSAGAASPTGTPP